MPDAPAAESSRHDPFPLPEDRLTLIRNPAPPASIEHALANGEGVLANTGALVVDTGRFTGRSPKDKFVVEDDLTRDQIAWGSINQPMSLEHFDRLREDMMATLPGKRLYVKDLWAGTDPSHRFPVRIVTELAWHSLFANNLFVRAEPAEEPYWTVVSLPSFTADPERHGCRTNTVVAVNFSERLVLIGNTEYAGEIKKGIFSVLNFDLPQRDVMPMHCSANEGDDGNVALFFGLSGTGKTTLSSDPERRLIGDDEHGWTDGGIFNFEGGCYAKVIDLSAENEPEIYAASNRFGTILENVGLDDDTRIVDFGDDALTENTRAAYPLPFIPNSKDEGRGGHPSALMFLTADAFGVLPPISLLDTAQAKYHFLAGYTAKVAGTERGVTEPQATFSACFGAPFMPLPPYRYAELLGEKLERHGARVWLLNTGWTGGPFGTGSRISLPYTRSMVRAALSGELADVEMRTDPVFGLAVPVECPGVPSELLDPRSTWDDAKAYDAQAAKLATMFREHFARFESEVSEEVLAAGPRL